MHTTCVLHYKRYFLRSMLLKSSLDIFCFCALESALLWVPFFWSPSPAPVSKAVSPLATAPAGFFCCGWDGWTRRALGCRVSCVRAWRLKKDTSRQCWLYPLAVCGSCSTWRNVAHNRLPQTINISPMTTTFLSQVFLNHKTQGYVLTPRCPSCRRRAPG